MIEDWEKILKELETFPMLAELPAKELEALLDICKLENFEVGSRIISEGDEGDTMYILLEGTVDVLKTTLYGEEYVYATLKDEYRCVFGEIALIDHDRRSATVQAKTVCRTLSVSAGDFRTFCRQNPAAGCELLLFISTNLCRNLRKENENLMKVYQALVEEIENI